jgi:beta-lactamase class A
MPRLLTRRALLITGSAFACSCALFGSKRAKSSAAIAQLEALRTELGGRLGVHAVAVGSGERIGIEDDGRYAMASTFKLLLAAAVLHRVDRGELEAEQSVPIVASDLVAHAPVTETQIARGSMTVNELCSAIMLVSDNAAANVLLRLIGGPGAVTRFARLIGDRVTRLDRIEPDLNENAPGDARDITSPRAMVDTMQRLLIGDVLRPASRDQLTRWLVESQTGLQRIRAGLPASWKVGDKTGTGNNGAVNDVAIATPPDGRTILIAIYMSESQKDVATLSAAHAKIAKIIANVFA